MQVAIHLGAHCTDNDRLLKSLLRNKGLLAKSGISVPGPGRYRGTLAKTIQKLRGAQASRETQEMLMDAIIDGEETQRVILSHESFICVPGRVFDNDMMYEKAGYKPEWLRNVFPNDQVEFFLGICNPATFVPSVFQHKAQNTFDFHRFLGGVDVSDIRWSDIIVAIQESSPDCPLTVWCNEDTPLIWRTVLENVCGPDLTDELNGTYSILSSIMKPEGMKRFRKYLSNNPELNEMQRRRVATVFLDKYAIEDEVEEELDVPGWTEELVHSLTETYEEDIFEIQRLPGVNFISP